METDIVRISIGFVCMLIGAVKGYRCIVFRKGSSNKLLYYFAVGFFILLAPIPTWIYWTVLVIVTLLFMVMWVRDRRKPQTLTQQQESLLNGIGKEWGSRVLNGSGTADEDAFRNSIEWIYKNKLKTNAPRIIFSDNDPEKTSALVLRLSNGYSVSPKLVELVNEAAIKKITFRWVSKKVGSQIERIITKSLGRTLLGVLTWPVASDRDTHFFCLWWYYDAMVQLDYLSRVAPNGLQNEAYWHLLTMAKTGYVGFHAYEDVVVVVKPPRVICTTTNARLHATTRPALVWHDGTAHYYVNGRPVAADIVEQPQRITRLRFLSETNMDHKGAMYEVLGQKKMFDLLGAEAVDTRTIVHQNGELETVTLYKTSELFAEIGDQPFAWVRMECPSTGTNYLAGVLPHFTSALDAIASLSRFKPDEYSFTDRA